ncbi:MAG: 23S rRNA (adenine(2503)-C(2))-methyltransferase RlmN [Chloroflexota bacterium]
MMPANKRLFYDISKEDLDVLIQGWGEPPYRAEQIWSGVYKQLHAAPNEISNISKVLQLKISDAFSFQYLEKVTELASSDQQTTKTLFRLHDGELIETVLMKYDKRRTLCISTQAGCAMGCVFCATGQMGFKRNLTHGEIIEQVLYFARKLKAIDDKITNIVVMGMGEPFHNYDATMAAIDLLNHKEGFNFGARRFTISTVGLIPAIKRFTKEKRQVNLAISLHSTIDDVRSAMLPINHKYPTKELLQVCKEYVQETGRRITFEWALIQDTNDSEEEAHSLGRAIKGINCHVNVIPLNPTEGYEGKRSTRDSIQTFQEILSTYGIPCTVRIRRGIDIDAGCGQLAIKN